MTKIIIEPQASSRFWPWWSAFTISSLGDAVTAVALPLVAVMVVGSSTFGVSLVVAANFAAWAIIGLPAGVIVERLPLRGTQVAMDIARAAMLVSIPIAAAIDALTLAQLVLVALVNGFATVLFEVANSTYLPVIVPETELTARNSMTSGSYAVSQTAGPAIGGLLVQAVGAASAILIDVVSYVISASLLLSLPARRQVRERQTGESFVQLVRDGCQYVAAHAVMRPCVVAATISNVAAGGLLAVNIPFLVHTLDVSPGLIGVLLAIEGVGSLVGATLITRMVNRWGSARTTIGASIVTALSILLVPLTTPGWGLAFFVAGFAVYAAFGVVLSVLWRTHRQTVTPIELLPRVMATVRFISWGGVPFGALLAGAAATSFGNRNALWIISAVECAVPVVLYFSCIRGLHSLDEYQTVDAC